MKSRKSTQQKDKERVKFWRDPALPNLEMLQATYVTHAFSRHAHEGFGIAIVEKGAMAFDYGRDRYIAPAGSVVVTHPGEMHTGEAATASGWTYRTMLPASDWLQQAAAALRDRPHQSSSALPYFASPLIQDKRLNRELIGLHRTLEKSPCALERESSFLWHMAQLVNQYGGDRPVAQPIGKEHAAVEKVRDYLIAHHSRNISLSELSHLVDLRPLRLLRVFRKQIGLPPHAYLNYVRVYKAKKLLANHWKIIDAAIATGFSDQSHLHRHFKKITGVTPGQYVKGCRKQ